MTKLTCVEAAAKVLSENLEESHQKFPKAASVCYMTRNVCRSKEFVEKEILRRIVEATQDKSKKFVDLNDLTLPIDNEQGIIKELEDLGYIFCNGKLYSDVEEFCHEEIMYTTDFFHSVDDEDPLVFRAVVNVPRHFIAGDGEIKPAYRGGIRWAVRFLNGCYDIARVNIVNCKPMEGYGRKWDNFFEVTVKVNNDEA